MHTKRILIVDDDFFMRETLTDVLREKGYEAHLAGDGNEAVRVVQEHSFDYALIDLKMAGMNGLDTYRAIKRVSPQVKCTIMTAYSHEDIIKECLREGAYGVLRKPLDIEEAMNHIEHIGIAKSVLFIEDQDMLRTACERLLGEQGVVCLHARDKDQAMKKAMQKPPQVLVIDMALPERVLSDMVKLLGDIFPRLPIVAWGDEQSSVLIESWGFSRERIDVIAKAVDTNALIEKISSCVLGKEI